MKLPVIKRLDKQDITSGGDYPSWMDGFLGALNAFIDPVVNALSGRLTFADNFLCTVSTQTYTHATELVISVPANRKVIGALPILAIKSTDTSATKNVISGWGLDVKGNGTLGLTVNFAGGAGKAADVTFVILLG